MLTTGVSGLSCSKAPHASGALRGIILKVHRLDLTGHIRVRTFPPPTITVSPFFGFERMAPSVWLPLDDARPVQIF